MNTFPYNHELHNGQKQLHNNAVHHTPHVGQEDMTMVLVKIVKKCAAALQLYDKPSH